SSIRVPHDNPVQLQSVTYASSASTVGPLPARIGPPLSPKQALPTALILMKFGLNSLDRRPDQGARRRDETPRAAGDAARPDRVGREAQAARGWRPGPGDRGVPGFFAFAAATTAAILALAARPAP